MSKERLLKRLDFAVQSGGSAAINGVEKVQAISVVRITCGWYCEREGGMEKFGSGLVT